MFTVLTSFYSCSSVLTADELENYRSEIDVIFIAVCVMMPLGSN